MVKKIISWFMAPHGVNVEPMYKSREVWSYQHIDPTTRRTSERPVLVFRKASDGMFWGLPLTNVGRNGKTLYVPRLKNGKKMPILSQMRTLKAERLVRRLGVAGEKEFGAVNTAILRLLAPAQPAKTVKKVRAERMYHIRTPLPRQPRTLSPLAPIYILQPR
jgi:hypothetical protein